MTAVHTEPAAHTVVALDSPKIMKYPVLYFSEPGTWAVSEIEARNFRDYLSRGGFAIFDDFDGQWDWEVFEANMAEVLPGQHFELLEETDPVYQSFFPIQDLDVITHPMGHGGPPLFLGIRDDAGPTRAGIRSTCPTKVTSSAPTTLFTDSRTSVWGKLGSAVPPPADGGPFKQETDGPLRRA